MGDPESRKSPSSATRSTGCFIFRVDRLMYGYKADKRNGIPIFLAILSVLGILVPYLVLRCGAFSSEL